MSLIISSSDKLVRQQVNRQTSEKNGKKLCESFRNSAK